MKSSRASRRRMRSPPERRPNSQRTPHVRAPGTPRAGLWRIPNSRTVCPWPGSYALALETKAGSPWEWISGPCCLLLIGVSGPPPLFNIAVHAARDTRARTPRWPVAALAVWLRRSSRGQPVSARPVCSRSGATPTRTAPASTGPRSSPTRSPLAARSSRRFRSDDLRMVARPISAGRHRLTAARPERTAPYLA